jgi:hypothetical protein
MRGVVVSLALLVALPFAHSAPSAGSADARPPARAAVPAPVPSLEPAKTAALWKKLVSARRTSAVTAECRPLRAVFYAATDWLRLATRLAAASSPCADYYVSIPPLVADKTEMRPDQAWRIRALGPRFHALAEIHFSTWSRWVAETGSSWHTAGVTARQRMAAAGYDVALGDSWVINELSSAVRRGDGNARANIREFLRGLYEGDGTRPTRGAAFVIGFGQGSADVSIYQNTLQHWLADSAFWTDMAAYVSDWSQEVYGDVRRHAVAAVPTPTRREYLNDYLQHKLVLAVAGPPEIEPARAYLREAYSPLANAAWQYDASYGWTAVTAEQMAAYVSAQVNALRSFSTAAAQPRDHWGFAWAPKNATGAAAADFAAQTSLVLDRMAAAIRDSGDVVEPESPGSGACGPPGQEPWCAVDVPGARHTDAWRSFRTWTSSATAFTTPAQTLVAGQPSAPIGLALVTMTGSRVTSTSAVRVATLSSSSPRGAFSTSPAGPWAPALSVSIPTNADAVVHYRDTRAGTPTLTASAAGSLSGSQTMTVTAGPAAKVTVTPVSGKVRARGKRTFAASARDAYGNAASGAFDWRVVPARLGKIRRAGATKAMFSAQRVIRRGRVVARVVSGGRTVTGSARVAVQPSRLRVGAIADQGRLADHAAGRGRRAQARFARSRRRGGAARRPPRGPRPRRDGQRRPRALPSRPLRRLRHRQDHAGLGSGVQVGRSGAAPARVRVAGSVASPGRQVAAAKPPRIRGLTRRLRAGTRATPSASRARSPGAGSRSCPRRSA